MCGIVGFTGNTSAKETLLEGLKRLEYRGYDSAGIALQNRDTKKIDTIKKQGKINILIEEASQNNTKAFCGIGHTRWATHGRPSDTNAHPHSDSEGMFSVVHNGIIENYQELKATLKNATLLSETDTEVIPNLIATHYTGDFLEAVQTATKQLKGSYALCILCRDYPGTVIAVKHESPLIIGKSVGASIIASDITAIIEHTDKIYILENDDIAVITGSETAIFNGGKEVARPLTKCEIKPESVSLNGHESFMYKEILEVPTAIDETLRHFDTQNALPKSYLKKIKSIRFIGCGTAYHAGLIGTDTVKKLTDIDAHADIASEFRYSQRVLPKNSLCVFISQSGETADTLGAVRHAKMLGATTLAVTNVASSSITRIADHTVLTKAGTEIAVASTKAYNAQVAAVYALCLLVAEARGTDTEDLLKQLKTTPEKAQKTLLTLPQIVKLAKTYSGQKCVFFIGRALDYRAAQEGSLKLKEISYIFSEAYPSGELKHGTLALIEKETLVIALATQKDVLDKTLSALHEVKARGAEVICISQYKEVQSSQAIDHVINLPEIEDIFSPLVSVIPLQLFAYFTTKEKGFDPDKPRNLAKSVTVE